MSLKIRKLANDFLESNSGDNIYESKKAEPFAFGSEVADVFDDMVARSVPQYLDAQLLSLLVCRKFAGNGSRVYDLGCSTGTTIGSLARELEGREIEIVGVDASASMLAKAEQKLEPLVRDSSTTIKLEECDLASFEFEPCSVVLMNYTLQFFPPEVRLQLLKRIHAALEPGGVLLLSEKTKCYNKLTTELHEDFKRMNGYSDIEIARKRESLKGVMHCLSEEENLALLDEAGFRSANKILQAYEFISWVVAK